MFKLLILAVVVVACSATLSQFESWRKEYGREYVDSKEVIHRLACFERNLVAIAEQNAVDTAVHGLNQFSDLCAHEFKRMYHNAVFPNHSSYEVAPELTAEDRLKANTTSYDWRIHGAVTKVKDQGQCGSCWAFSAVGAMEGAWVVKGNPLVSLSEEQITQCATAAGSGCDGGDMPPAIDYVVKNGGINSEAGYPYKSGGGTTGKCNKKEEAVHVAKFTKHVSVPAGKENDLETYLLKYGPLAIGVDANNGWQTYKSGIKSSCSKDIQIDHGVTLVGYGVQGATKYWIVKNSWAATWGEHGYIRIKRGSDCDGIAKEGTAAVAA